tara:strand:- start:1264 stop:1590 length:327 start_codon:yes stop_codon:yes gene_type:complete
MTKTEEKAARFQIEAILCWADATMTTWEVIDTDQEAPLCMAFCSFHDDAERICKALNASEGNKVVISRECAEAALSARDAINTQIGISNGFDSYYQELKQAIKEQNSG